MKKVPSARFDQPSAWWVCLARTFEPILRGLIPKYSHQTRLRVGYARNLTPSWPANFRSLCEVRIKAALDYGEMITLWKFRSQYPEASQTLRSEYKQDE